MLTCVNCAEVFVLPLLTPSIMSPHATFLGKGWGSFAASSRDPAAQQVTDAVTAPSKR